MRFVESVGCLHFSLLFDDVSFVGIVFRLFFFFEFVDILVFTLAYGLLRIHLSVSHVRFL